MAIPTEQIEQKYTACSTGSKAARLAQSVRSFGISGKALRREPEELRHLPLPMIAFWKGSDIALIEGFGGDGSALINDPDPDVLPQIIGSDEFDKAFTGVVIVFQQLGAFEGGKQPGLSKLISERIPQSSMTLLFIALATAALVVPNLLTPAFSAVFIDDILVDKLTRWTYPLVALVFVAALIKGAATYLQQASLLRFEAKLGLTSSSQFLWHILRLPKDFFDRHMAGEVGSWLDLSDRVAGLLAQDVATNIAGVFLLVFYVILMARYNVLLTVITVAIVSINLFVLRQLSNTRTSTNQRLIQKRGKLIGTAVGGLQSIETLKATGFEGVFFSEWAERQALVLNEEQKAWAACIPLFTLPSLLISINSAAIMYVGGLQVMNGKLTLGMLIGFQALVIIFFDPVSKLLDLGSKLQDTKADMLKISDVSQIEEDRHIGQEGVNSEQWDNVAKLNGTVRVDEVTFGYNRLVPPLVTDLSFAVRPGERVALVGSSGSGKSTVAKLLCGLYEPWDGELRLDEAVRRKIPRRLLNDSIALVDQDISFFDGTIRDNLTLWDSTLDESVMIQAAKDACIHDDIMNIAGGYDSWIEEGGRNFSGGQRQRLEIARALVLSPRILILDEATSALDPATEQIVDQNLRRRGCTCIIVAHRLSTVRDCQEIIVLERGKVVQRGTHEQLRAVDGPYSNLLKAC
jgi:NHLM bacteriocin system ABC transporter peptidase/ATP-binding protein